MRYIHFDSDDIDVEQSAEGISEEKVDGGASIVKRTKNAVKAFRKGDSLTFLLIGADYIKLL